MAKQKKVLQKSKLRHRKATPCLLRPCHSKIMKDYRQKKQIKASEKKEWKDATCSVCMEYPHKAVLLLCDSYHKNCRPYMCATGYRYSNCLDQYKKAYTKVNSTQNDPNISSDPEELLCPLCRGQVKGWTVVKRARKYLNAKKRSCMQDNCLFVGSYKDLKKHVRASHPLARPREVDASLIEKWKKFENESEFNDVISTIYSTMPGAIIQGDYVIEDDYRNTSRVRGIGNRRLYTRTGFGPGNGQRRLPVRPRNTFQDAHTSFGPGNGNRRFPVRSRNNFLNADTSFGPVNGNRLYSVGSSNVSRTYGSLPRDREISQLSEDESSSDDANAGRPVDNRNQWAGSHQYISSSEDDYEGIINESARTYSNRGGVNQSSSSEEEEESSSDDDVIIMGSAHNDSSRRGISPSSSEDSSSDDDGSSIKGHVRTTADAKPGRVRLTWE